MAGRCVIYTFPPSVKLFPMARKPLPRDVRVLVEMGHSTDQLIRKSRQAALKEPLQTLTNWMIRAFAAYQK